MEVSPPEDCEKCGGSTELVWLDICMATRCTVCGHSIATILDPYVPELADPDEDADGLLIVDSYNGQEVAAGMEFRKFLTLTPQEALKLVRERPTQLRWPFRNGIRRLTELKQRLDSIGVSSRITRVKEGR